MKTNKTNSGKQEKDRNKNQSQNTSPKGEQQQGKEPTSQGHTAGATGSKEPTLRGSTTDSSRTHKNPHDDLPTGGNIR